jgi:hypothetical protein
MTPLKAGVVVGGCSEQFLLSLASSCYVIQHPCSRLGIPGSYGGQWAGHNDPVINPSRVI